ncbi:MAG: S8 family serine peptidase [Limisphaerales bacterium]
MHRYVYDWSVPKRVGIGVLALLFLFFLSDTTAFAQVLRGVYTLQDGGQTRVFEVALDEVYVRSQNSAQTIPVAAFGQVDAVRTHAELLTRTTGNETELVLYEAGRPRDVASRRVLTKQVLVRMAPGAVPGPLAAMSGAAVGAEISHLPGHYLFTTAQTGSALTVAEWLRAQPGVISADPQLARQMVRRFIPNDPFFTNQWHLRNTGQNGGTPGMDINVTNVWDNFRGTGVTIGIVDDGLQGTHPDLTNNVNFAIGHDYNFGDNDPSPNVLADFHGTAVAGVAAGRGNNGRGICGVAFEATLAGIRLIAAPTTDAQEAAAMLHSNAVVFVSNNSWGPADDAQNLSAPGPQMAAALASATTTGRGGLGTIFLWAAGNGGQVGDNANYDGYANSIYTIAVGALNDLGRRASYSEPGADVVISAPSGNDSTRPQGTSTTDLVGTNGYNTGTSPDPLEYTASDYTSRFNGTSSASPVAAGVVALLLQANPTLGWRDVQEILIRSATVNQPTHSDWFTNGAGFHFNHDFGAGLVNAGVAVALATNWTNLTPQFSYSAQQTGLGLSIPDNNSNGVTYAFNVVSGNIRVEHVTLTVNITHSFRGDLAVDLISPAGTVSRLAERHSDPNRDYQDWTFMSVRHWGELADGTWTVRVSDRSPSDAGVLNSLALRLYGTFTNVSGVVAPPTITTQPRSRTVTQGSTVTLSVGVAPDATLPVNYQWRFNDNDIFGEVSSTLVLTNVQSSAAGLYSVRVVNPFGTNLSANAALFVNAPPQVTTHPTNQSVILGSNVTFTVAASGSEPLSYQWRFNGTPIGGAVNASYTITGAQTNQAGSYDVLVGNSFASVFSSNAVLSVLPPFTIDPQPLSQSVPVGSNVTLVVGATGIGAFAGPFTYQWTFNGAALTDATNTSLISTNLQLASSGAYACVVGSPLGAIISSNAVVAVFNPFTVDSLAFQLGGFLRIAVSGDNGRAYRLESSTNLIDWVSMVTNTVSGGTATFTDGGAVGQPFRFYRTVLLP